MDKETILVFAAHPDDEIIGVGGTIAKYAQEGKDVIVTIFSDGSLSAPWMKQTVLIQDRKKEAKDIGKFMGCKDTIFAGLKDGSLQAHVHDVKMKEILKKIIIRYKPSKIFVHSHLDAHADHRAVNEMVLKAVKELDGKHSVYTFEVWNALPEQAPALYVDITSTFAKKIQAMKKFKSQKVFIYTLLIPVYVRAYVAGFHNKTRYAEKFYKIQ